MTREWLVEVGPGGAIGQVHRWATRDLEVETSAGEVLVFRGGLVDVPETAAGDEGITLSVVDTTLELEAREDLDGVPVRLLRWEENTAYERAELYARGTARQVQYGAVDEPVAWTISDDHLELVSPMPDPLAVVNEDTWPIDAAEEIPPAVVGRSYPVVFGYPGYAVNISGVARWAPVPVPFAQYDTAAGSPLNYVVVSEDAAALTGTNVRIRNADNVSEGLFGISTASDLLGRRLALARIDDLDKYTVRPESADDPMNFYAGFAPDEAGGVHRAWYDVARYALARWGADTYDEARLPEIRDHVGGFLVDTWLDQPVTNPWIWIETVFLPHLPIAIRLGARGRYFVPKVYVADPLRSVGVVDVDGGRAVRNSNLSRASQPINEFEAWYRRTPGSVDDHLERRWLARTILSSTNGYGAIQFIHDQLVRDTRCAISQDRYGVRASSIEIDWTWDEGTVHNVLSWMAARDCFPARSVAYLLREDDMPRESEIVEVRDAEVGLDSVYAIVDEPPVVVGDGTTLVTLRIPSTR